MTSLMRLTASDNEFTFLPEELFDCPSLEVMPFFCLVHWILKWDEQVLILDGNQLQELPYSIGRASKLVQLSLASNKLQRVPVEVGDALRSHSQPHSHLGVTEGRGLSQIGKLRRSLRDLNLESNPLQAPPRSVFPASMLCRSLVMFCVDLIFGHIGQGYLGRRDLSNS